MVSLINGRYSAFTFLKESGGRSNFWWRSLEFCGLNTKDFLKWLGLDAFIYNYFIYE